MDPLTRRVSCLMSLSAIWSYPLTTDPVRSEPVDAPKYCSSLVEDPREPLEQFGTSHLCLARPRGVNMYAVLMVQKQGKLCVQHI